LLEKGTEEQERKNENERTWTKERRQSWMRTKESTEKSRRSITKGNQRRHFHRNNLNKPNWNRGIYTPVSKNKLFLNVTTIQILVSIDNYWNTREGQAWAWIECSMPAESKLDSFKQLLKELLEVRLQPNVRSEIHRNEIYKSCSIVIRMLSQLLHVDRWDWREIETGKTVAIMHGGVEKSMRKAYLPT